MRMIDRNSSLRVLTDLELTQVCGGNDEEGEEIVITGKRLKADNSFSSWDWGFGGGSTWGATSYASGEGIGGGGWSWSNDEGLSVTITDDSNEEEEIVITATAEQVEQAWADWFACLGVSAVGAAGLCYGDSHLYGYVGIGVGPVPVDLQSVPRRILTFTSKASLWPEMGYRGLA